MNEWKKDLAKVAEIERHALATKNESLLEKARMTRARIERRLALDGRTDLELAELFLFGQFTQTKGKVRLKYLEGSEEDEPGEPSSEFFVATRPPIGIRYFGVWRRSLTTTHLVTGSLYSNAGERAGQG